MNKEDSELQVDVNSLIDWLSETHTIPPYDDVKVTIDLGDLIEDGADTRVPINQENLVSTSAYADEYRNLKNSGLSWINLHCAGIYENDLIIVIEHPRKSSNSAQASINLSGPVNDPITNTPNWSFEANYKVVD